MSDGDAGGKAAPEAILGGIVAVLLWSWAWESVGTSFGGGWMVVMLVATIGALVVWGYLERAPQRRLRQEKARRAAEIERVPGKNPAVIQTELAELDAEFRERERALRAAKRIRPTEELSASRKVIRQGARAILLAISLPLAVLFCVTAILLLPAVALLALWLLIGGSALVPALAVLAAECWLLWRFRGKLRRGG